MNNPSTPKTSHSIEQVITDTLTNPRVVRHHKKMFEHGTKEDYPHESAYVMYEQNSGVYKPSRLISTNPEEHHGGIEHGMRSIAIGELILDHSGNLKSEPEYTDIETRTIQGIMAADELSNDEKEKLIEKLREKAENRAKGVHASGMRQDVPIDTHSHPMLKYWESIDDMLVPSLADVEIHEKLHKANPGHVSAIVTSNGTDNAVLLYGAEVGREQDYHGYDIDSNHHLSELGRRGLVSTVILLDTEGLPLENQGSSIKDFARQIKTKK